MPPTGTAAGTPAVRPSRLPVCVLRRRREGVARPGVHAMSESTNPVRRFADLSMQTYVEERDRVLDPRRRRREPPFEWGPRVQARDAQLLALFAAALRDAAQTGRD